MAFFFGCTRTGFVLVFITYLSVWELAKRIIIDINHSSAHTANTNTEIWKQLFPEKELCGHSPNFHIHASVSDLYIPTIDLPILMQEKCGTILGIYKLITDT
jgi:hypothetical protein